jgi:Putative polyhydroxyalkanoic acid system protein (PHA_gran_rgn)
MKHVIPHDLDLATAKRATDRAFEEYKRRFPGYQPSLRWADERGADVGFNVKGIQLSGTVRIEEKSVELDLDVPFLFRPFQKIALEVIEREVRVWLEKARTGEL